MLINRKNTIKQLLINCHAFLARVTLLASIISTRLLCLTIGVMKNALGGYGWVKVGQINHHPMLNQTHKFYKFDLISKKFSIYSDGIETPATREECLELECAAVWEKSHVEDRLLAKSQGEQCVWTTSLSAATRV